MESNHYNLRHKRRKLAHEDMASETDIATPQTDIATPQTEGATAEKHVNDLPDEILAKILGYLPRHDLVRNASAVCWRWHKAAFDQDNWKEIDVRVGDKMSVQDLCRLVKKSTKKLIVTCPSCDQMLYETFPAVLEKSSTLHTLIMNMMKSQQNSDLVVKSRSLRTMSRIALSSIELHCGVNLRKLCLFEIDGLNDRTLISILRSCNQLDKLSLAFCKNLSTSVLSVIGENASQLTGLMANFRRDKRLSERSIENLVDSCTMLTSLHIYANFSIRKDLKCIGKLKRLQVLAIKPIYQLIDDDTMIHWITECRDLIHLSLCSPIVTDKTLEAISSSNLKCVDMIIPSRITHEGLEYLVRSRSLICINIIVYDDNVPVNANEIVKFAQNLKTLEKMNIFVNHPNHPLCKQMKAISSVWKGVLPISLIICSQYFFLKFFRAAKYYRYVGY